MKKALTILPRYTRPFSTSRSKSSKPSSILRPGKKLFALFWLFVSFSAIGQVTYSTQPLATGLEFGGTATGAVQVADINGDGFPDVVYVAAIGGPITYLQNNGSGSFSTPASNPFGAYTVASPAGFVPNVNTHFDDYDGDGDLDIWCRVAGAANDVYLQNNSGTYVTSSVPAGLEFTGTTTGIMQVADINHDGFPDALYVSAVGGPITYLQNNGSGSFSTPATNPFAAYTVATPAGFTLSISAVIADYDGDGDLDVWCRVAGAANDVYLKNNSGTYVTSTLPSGLEFSGTATGVVQVADINGDGVPDVFYVSAVGGPITYLQNNGSGSFSTPATNPFGSYTVATPAGFTLNTSANIADYDGDGDLDIWSRVAGAANDVYLKASGEAPYLTSSNPANNSTNIDQDANIVLNFSENVVVGPGNIYIRNLSGNAVVQTIAANSALVTGSGTKVLTINPPANFSVSTTYYVTFDRNAIADVDEGLIFGHIDPMLKVRVPETGNDFLRFTTTSVPLPVTLVNFTASLLNGNALLKWQTASEQNSRDFTVQRSSDGINWKNLQVLPAAGNSTQLLNYQFVDARVLRGKNYYRLLHTNINGKQEVSAVRLLKEGKTRMTIYPNPTANTAILQLAESGAATIIVYNAGGQQVQRKVTNTTSVKLSLASLPTGTYQVVVLQNGERHTQQVQRN